MKAVVYGAGNIGRGFIGLILSESKYKVTFIDVADSLVIGLNERQEYPVRITSNNGYKDIIVTGVKAINGNNKDAVASAIADADIVATSVGVDTLKHIVPNLVGECEGISVKRHSMINID